MYSWPHDLNSLSFSTLSGPQVWWAIWFIFTEPFVSSVPTWATGEGTHYKWPTKHHLTVKIQVFLQNLEIPRGGCLASTPRIYRGVYSRRGALIPCQVAYLQRDREGITRLIWKIYWPLLTRLTLLAWEIPCTCLFQADAFLVEEPQWRLYDQTVNRLLCLSSVFFLF